MYRDAVLCHTQQGDRKGFAAATNNPQLTVGTVDQHSFEKLLHMIDDQPFAAASNQSKANQTGTHIYRRKLNM